MAEANPLRSSRPRSLPAALLAGLARSIGKLFDHYHPELHYMRGPGPKWREKHALPPRPATADPFHPGILTGA